MKNFSQVLTPLLLGAVAGCAFTPELQTTSSGMTMAVKAKAAYILRVDYSPDGKSVAAAALDGTIRLWDLAGGNKAIELKGHSASDISYSPDGSRLASIGTDGTMRFWDVRTGKEIRVISGYRSVHTHRLFYSPDGKYVLGASWTVPLVGKNTETLNLHDVRTGEVVRQYEGYPGRISPDGKYLLKMKIFGDYVLELADFGSGNVIWKTRTEGTAFHGPTFIFSPDGKHILLSERRRNDSRIRLLDTTSGFGVRDFILPADAVPSTLAFSPDGRLFVSGDDKGRYKLWDVASANLVRQFNTVDETSGTLLDIRASAKFAPDGRTVVLTSLGATRLFEVASGNELATMIAFEDGEWLVTTPSGYYNASEKGDQYLNVAVAGKAYSIGQLREAFFRPDLVRAAMVGKPLGELRTIADIKPPPFVAIIETPTVVSSDEVIVNLSITDQGGGVGDVRLYRNGSAVMLEQRRNLQVGQAGQTLRYKVGLEGGANTIRAVAFNADNSMQSSDATITVTASVVARRPSLYAVVVGIQDFKNPRLKLSYPIADARLFADALRRQSGDLYLGVNVELLTTPEQTTRENLLRVLRTMKDRVRPEDLFVFFVASHGTAEEGEYFLITSNVGALSTERLRLDALTQAHLKEVLANIPTTKKLIVIDTCNAGALGDALQVAFLTRGMTDATAIKILGRAVGSTVLSASTSMQTAVEGYRGHGLFTYVIAEGLAGKADRNNDGFVSTLELATYVDDRVPVLAEEVFKHAQYPVVSPSGQGFPLVRVVK